MKRMGNLFCCKGRTALVTGGSRGLGFQAANALADAGATVIMNGRDRSALDVAANAIRKRGGSVEILPGDLTRSARVVIEQGIGFTGSIDILVHAAATRDRRGTSELSEDAFRSLVDTNLNCAYDLARAALPHLARSSSGRLIFVSSIAARLARSGDPAYAASKAGLSALTRALAVEHGNGQLTVNSIEPGFFATETNEKLAHDPGIQSFIDMRVPSKRWGRPEEIASAVLFLASPASSYVNGTSLTVDGGLSAQM